MPDDLDELEAIRRLRRKPANRPVKIFVGELTSATTSADLRSLFEPYGPVTSAEVFVTGKVAFGRVVMTDGGREAIAGLNGRVVDGRRIEVDELD